MLALDARPRTSRAPFRLAGGLGAAALLAAAVLTPLASASPDGLEATAAKVGFAGAARDHLFAAVPLADYGEAAGLSVQLVGLLGVALVAAVALATAKAVRIARPALAA
jgi:cobalt/nickel transport system permease protein